MNKYLTHALVATITFAGTVLYERAAVDHAITAFIEFGCKELGPPAPLHPLAPYAKNGYGCGSTILVIPRGLL